MSAIEIFDNLRDGLCHNILAFLELEGVHCEMFPAIRPIFTT